MSRMPEIGISLPEVKELNETLVNVREHGYKFICSNVMTNERTAAFLKQKMGGPGGQSLGRTFSWPDVVLNANDWRKGVVGGISDLSSYIQDENFDPIGRRAALELLKIQIDYCRHLSLPAALFELTNSVLFSLAREVRGIFEWPFSGPTEGWIKVKLGSNEQKVDDIDNWEDPPLMDSWKTWNMFRTICEFNPLIFPVLELQQDTPTEPELAKWLGETVRALIIPTSVFTSESQNNPILSPRHQKIVKEFMNAGIKIIIQAEKCGPTLKLHSQYILHLWSFVNEMRTEAKNIARSAAGGYLEVLQTSLQPRQDNQSQSFTYNVFEGDAQKYVLYERAINAALVHTVSDKDKHSRIVVLMVLGARSGGIVVSCLRAGIKSNRKLKVYALEQDYNAVNTLIHLRDTKWHDAVTVVHSDIRMWNPSEKADIIVSDCLGSFGDNEASPEWLDSAERFLKEGGLMIPQSYTSYIAPVMTPHFYCQTMQLTKSDKQTQGRLETPYVVKLDKKYDIDEPKPLFTFSHPNKMPLEAKSNDRFKALQFVASQHCLLTGFAGYFKCVLYEDVQMSIFPSTHSENMLSLSPIYFPLKDPVYCSKNDTIQVDFLRKIEPDRMWYEWALLKPAITSVHNFDGKYSRVELQ